MDTYTPGIAKHERTVHKEHIEGNICFLVSVKLSERCAPVIINLLDVFCSQVFECYQFCFCGLYHVGKLIIDPLSSFPG